MKAFYKGFPSLVNYLLKQGVPYPKQLQLIEGHRLLRDFLLDGTKAQDEFLSRRSAEQLFEVLCLPNYRGRMLFLDLFEKVLRAVKHADNNKAITIFSKLLSKLSKHQQAHLLNSLMPHHNKVVSEMVVEYADAERI